MRNSFVNYQHPFKFLILTYLLSLATIATGVLQDAAPIVGADNGIIVIEAESAADLGNWVKHSDSKQFEWLNGFTGTGCIQFTGNTEVSGPPDSILTYRIKVDEAGDYKLMARALEAPMITGEGDKANDCYIRLAGVPNYQGEFTKFVLLGKSYQWSWNVKLESAHHYFESPVYPLKEGVYQIQVAGRSRNFFLDRMVLYKIDDGESARDLSLDAREAEEEFRYEPDFDSIRSRYEVPEWFRDAKFGIFLHWGPYAVPAYSSEKYPKGIYQYGWNKGGMRPYTYHREHYGDPSEFGYKDLIPLFKAENYDASEWAKLFKDGGARYVVPVAEHHDGYAMYASNHTRWNVKDTGPKKDTMRMLADACRAEGMKFGVSSHYALNRVYYSKKDPSWDTNDPEYYDLYGKPVGPDELPTQEFIDHWWDRTTDIIDQYEPDLLWFDFGLDKPGFESVHKEILSYYYNKGLDWGKGVVFQDKNMKYHRYPEDLIVLDIERGRMDSIYKYPWQTDTSIGVISWGYIDDEEYKSPDYLLDELIDIVSKNGCLLLNIGPKADGTIPEEAKEILAYMGTWLKLNGDVIYDTRPWKIHGEGPTEVAQGHHSEKNNQDSGPEDIRFTTKGDTLFATALGWPANGTFNIKSLAKGNPFDSREIASLQFISGSNKISWKQTSDGLTIQVRGKKPCEAAYAFQIQFK